jgi:hypothetical protein
VLDTIRQVCLSHACILLDIPARCSCPSFPPHSTAVEPPDQSSTAHSFQLLKPASRHYRRGISGPSLPTLLDSLHISRHQPATAFTQTWQYYSTTPSTPNLSPLIPISTSITNMGVEKIMLKPGDGVTTPKKHDEVSMEYTGSPTISSPSSSLTHIQAGSTTSMHQTRRAIGERTHRSLSRQQSLTLSRFDTSIGRGELITPIGVGRVIKGALVFVPQCVPCVYQLTPLA